MSQYVGRWAKLVGLLGVLSLIVPLFAVNAGAQEEKSLRIHQLLYPETADPQKSSFSNEIVFLATNYEGLTRLDENLETVPAAAESWEFNEEATELTFTLRDGLTYSDGSPLTAENFRYAVERTCDPNTAGEYQSILFEIVGCADFAGLAGDDPEKPAEFTDEQYEEARAALGAEAVDDTTLRLTFTQPAPYFATVAGLWVFYPAKQELIEEGGEDWWTDAANHVGNGPFQVTEMEQDQLIVLEANENYWGGRPKVDRLEYVYVPESAAALEAYRDDDPENSLDIMQPDPSQLTDIREDAALSEQLTDFPLAATTFLGFNLTQEPFNDKKVREAFAYALDRETYCTEIRNGDCEATLTWIPEGVPGAIESDLYAFDPEKAKAALAESSYGGPEELPEIRFFFNSDDPANQPRIEWIAGQYRDILGVDITLEPTEGQTLVALRKDPSTYPQMTLPDGWIQDYPDPQNWLSVFWGCDTTFAKRRGYCNEQLDELMGKGDTTVDPEERIGYYEQAGQVLLEDVPGVMFYNSKGIFLVKPEVTGYATTPADFEWPGQWASLLTIDVNR